MIDDEKQNDRVQKTDEGLAEPPRSEVGQLLYYENRKIRHMERMFDLFLALFR